MQTLLDLRADLKKARLEDRTRAGTSRAVGHFARRLQTLQQRLRKVRTACFLQRFARISSGRTGVAHERRGRFEQLSADDRCFHLSSTPTARAARGWPLRDS